DFKSAVDTALSVSKDFQGAKADVRELVNRYASAVADEMPHIRIYLSRFGELGKTAGLLATIATIGSISAPRRIGDDAEDKDARLLVVASNGTTDKILWEVILDKGAGYPITIVGPEGDATNLCFTQEDLRTAFIDAAGKGVVGRKLRSLAPPVEAD
ncbi:MAG: hypothetical protein JKY56_14475, partial [Kofleriaceae bacterium]|nr:hypothetical protein [Kofleriaceae bacterium]